MDDPSGRNEENDEVHNIPKSWPHPTVDSGDMAVRAPPLLIFSLYMVHFIKGITAISPAYTVG